MCIFILVSTASGVDNPSMVADIYSGGSSSPADLTVFNNQLYFQAKNGSDGEELWVYDTATNPPSMAADINTGASSSSPADLAVFNNKLYFRANDGSNGD